MKKLLALFPILLSAQILLASDTPGHKPFPHGHYPVFAAHHHPGYGHPGLHGPAAHFRSFHEPMQVFITIPDLSAGDAEIESNGKLDMAMISLPSYEKADAEMNLLADLRISVGTDYESADAEMEANHRLDGIKISMPSPSLFSLADGEIHAQMPMGSTSN